VVSADSGRAVVFAKFPHVGYWSDSSTHHREILILSPDVAAAQENPFPVSLGGNVWHPTRDAGLRLRTRSPNRAVSPDPIFSARGHGRRGSRCDRGRMTRSMQTGRTGSLRTARSARRRCQPLPRGERDARDPAARAGRVVSPEPRYLRLLVAAMELAELTTEPSTQRSVASMDLIARPAPQLPAEEPPRSRAG